MKLHEILATIMAARDAVRKIESAPLIDDAELGLIQCQLANLTNDIREAQATLEKMREAA